MFKFIDKMVNRREEKKRYQAHIKDMEAARYAANMRNTAPLVEQQARNIMAISEMNELNNRYGS